MHVVISLPDMISCDKSKIPYQYSLEHSHMSQFLSSAPHHQLNLKSFKKHRSTCVAWSSIDQSMGYSGMVQQIPSMGQDEM